MLRADHNNQLNMKKKVLEDLIHDLQEFHDDYGYDDNVSLLTNIIEKLNELKKELDSQSLSDIFSKVKAAGESVLKGKHSLFKDPKFIGHYLKLMKVFLVNTVLANEVRSHLINRRSFIASSIADHVDTARNNYDTKLLDQYIDVYISLLANGVPVPDLLNDIKKAGRFYLIVDLILVFKHELFKRIESIKNPDQRLSSLRNAAGLGEQGKNHPFYMVMSYARDIFPANEKRGMLSYIHYEIEKAKNKKYVDEKIVDKNDQIIVGRFFAQIQQIKRLVLKPNQEELISSELKSLIIDIKKMNKSFGKKHLLIMLDELTTPLDGNSERHLLMQCCKIKGNQAKLALSLFEVILTNLKEKGLSDNDLMSYLNKQQGNDATFGMMLAYHQSDDEVQQYLRLLNGLLIMGVSPDAIMSHLNIENSSGSTLGKIMVRYRSAESVSLYIELLSALLKSGVTAEQMQLSSALPSAEFIAKYQDLQKIQPYYNEIVKLLSGRMSDSTTDALDSFAFRFSDLSSIEKLIRRHRGNLSGLLGQKDISDKSLRDHLYEMAAHHPIILYKLLLNNVIPDDDFSKLSNARSKLIEFLLDEALPVKNRQAMLIDAFNDGTPLRKFIAIIPAEADKLFEHLVELMHPAQQCPMPLSSQCEASLYPDLSKEVDALSTNQEAVVAKIAVEAAPANVCSSELISLSLFPAVPLHEPVQAAPPNIASRRRLAANGD